MNMCTLFQFANVLILEISFNKRVHPIYAISQQIHDKREIAYTPALFVNKY
jgi:hypothetical protein